MSPAIINADCFTETHRISCRIEVGATGIIALLNDTTTSLMDVRDAYISYVAEPAKIVAHFETASLQKTNLAVIILARREDIGPAGLARAGYTRMLQYAVLITTPTYEIRGQVETPGKLDPAALLLGGTGKFISLYKATIVATHHPDKNYSGEAILINRTLVATLAPMPKGHA